MKNAIIVGLIAPLLYLAALGLGLVEAAQGGSDRYCYDPAKWAAKAGQRPCVKIVRLYEDGSFSAVVTKANGQFRYKVGVGAKDLSR